MGLLDIPAPVPEKLRYTGHQCRDEDNVCDYRPDQPLIVGVVSPPGDS